MDTFEMDGNSSVKDVIVNISSKFQTNQCHEKSSHCAGVESALPDNISRYSCEDNMVSANKVSNANDSSFLCWNDINELPTGNLPPIKELQSQLFSSSNTNIVSTLINSDICEDKGSTMSSFSVSDRSFQSLPQVDDALSNVMINDSAIQDIKMDQLNYMNILSCDSDLNTSDLEDCSVTDNSIITLNQNLTVSSNLLNLNEDKIISSSSLNSVEEHLLQNKPRSDLMNNNGKQSSETICSSAAHQNSLFQIPSVSCSDASEMATSKTIVVGDNSKNSKMDINCKTNDTQTIFMSLNSSIASTSESIREISSCVTSPSISETSHCIVTSPYTSSSVSSKVSAQDAALTTTIVPSLKNIITCPAPVQLLCVQPINFGNSIASKDHVVAKEDKFIEEVTCKKCKLCSFVSLEKSVVMNHLKQCHGVDLFSRKILNSNPKTTAVQELSSQNLLNTKSGISNHNVAVKKLTYLHPVSLGSSNSVTSSVLAAKQDNSSSSINSEVLKIVCSFCSKLFNSVQELNFHTLNDHKIIINLKESMNETSKPNHSSNQMNGNIQCSSDSMSFTDVSNEMTSELNVVKTSSMPVLETTKENSSMCVISNNLPVGTSDIKDSVNMIFCPAKEIQSANRQVNIHQCSICQEIFDTEDKCKTHIVSNHKMEVITSGMSDAMVKDSNRTDLTNLPGLNSSENLNSEKENVSQIEELSCTKVETPDNCKKRHQTKKKKKGDERFTCDFKRCNVSFRLEKNLNIHKSCHIHDPDNGGFSCPECKIKIEQWRNMTTHLWKVHSIDLELHKCDVCDYKTWSYSRLHSAHKLIHGEVRAFLCDICGKSFKTCKQMQNHKIIHTSKKKVRRQGGTFSCDVCGKSFRHDRILQLHKEAVHEKIRPYLCNFCGYCASSRSSLKMHLRLHTGEKPYSCNLCVYKTGDHNSLRRHKMTHSGEKPYKCPYCHYACIQSSTYKTHLKRKHFDREDGLLYSCNYCSFKTIRQGILDSHMSDHHIEAISIDKFNTINHDVELDGSVSINLLPENDGSVTLTSKGKPVKVIEFVQVPDSNIIQASGMNSDLRTLTTTGIGDNLNITSASNSELMDQNPITLSSDINFEVESSMMKKSHLENCNHNNGQVLFV